MPTTPHDGWINIVGWVEFNERQPNQEHVPRIYSVIPEIIDNSQTFHYRLEHYGNYNFADFCVHFVNFDEKKSSP